MLAPLLAALLAVPAAPVASADTADEAASRIELWPGGIAPGSERSGVDQTILERSADPALPDRILTGITRPHLVVHRPARPNGAALLVAPGGGYQRIVLDKEGSAIAPLFAEEFGYTLFVLRYRLPDEGHANGRDAPLADAQRALRLIRARAGEWKLDPRRIGVIGFSAGGHVAASLATRFDEAVYAPVDAIDTHSARPDFALPIYPVIDMGEHAHPGSRERLLGSSPSAAEIAAYSLQHRVTATTPPSFLLHAQDDASVRVENSLLFYDALQRAGVPAALHVFPRGGHGFGIRGAVGPLAIWPRLAHAWIESLATPPVAP